MRISEIIIEKVNAQNPIIVSPGMREQGIENLDKIVRAKIVKKWIKKLNKFFNKYPTYRKILENHDNYKNLLLKYPEIEKGLKSFK